MKIFVGLNGGSDVWKYNKQFAQFCSPLPSIWLIPHSVILSLFPQVLYWVSLPFISSSSAPFHYFSSSPSILVLFFLSLFLFSFCSFLILLNVFYLSCPFLALAAGVILSISQPFQILLCLECVRACVRGACGVCMWGGGWLCALLRGSTYDGAMLLNRSVLTILGCQPRLWKVVLKEA